MSTITLLIVVLLVLALLGGVPALSSYHGLGYAPSIILLIVAIVLVTRL